MPWSAASARRHTKKAKTTGSKSRWARIANSVLGSSHDEGKAIRIANAAMKKHRGRRRKGAKR